MEKPGIVADIEKQADIDYVSVSAGVHHSFIHTPMHYEAGWERPYARAIKDVSSKPVWLVGRFTHPDQAEAALVAGDSDAILLGRQSFADPEFANLGSKISEDLTPMSYRDVEVLVGQLASATPAAEEFMRELQRKQGIRVP
mgnify:CR=1 FL=1